MAPASRALVLAVVVLVISGCSLAGRTLGGYVDDTLVKSAVKRRLATESVAGISGVKVDTFGGTVYLSGAVETARQKSDAEIAAWRVEGVQQVVNDLVVTRPAAIPAAAGVRAMPWGCACQAWLASTPACRADPTWRTTRAVASWRASTRSTGATSSRPA
jgi:hypothetical protein